MRVVGKIATWQNDAMIFVKDFLVKWTIKQQLLVWTAKYFSHLTPFGSDDDASLSGVSCPDVGAVFQPLLEQHQLNIRLFYYPLKSHVLHAEKWAHLIFTSFPIRQCNLVCRILKCPSPWSTVTETGRFGVVLRNF
ncbi:Soluble scavenger receptor cysteine-rich domain-containing protein SSC5D [Trichinella spiralis]|uniref:Soluble scavenger receptor cysteine-rich domain-containing protein SSC5D n=1 Tax=Trichinella spiralis TaxID=6334 RepID=A0ABR3KCU5_TRISP